MRAQCVLDSRTKLGQDVVGHILRRLGDKENSDSLRTDEPHRLHHLVEELLRRVVEQQVGLVEEENEARLVEVAYFGEVAEERGEQPHREGGEQRGLRLHVRQFKAGDEAATVGGGAQQLGGVEGRFAEEGVGALGLQRGNLAQDDARGGRSDPTDLRKNRLTRGARQVLQRGAQVRQIDERQSLGVCPSENEGERRLLRLVETKRAGQQQRPEIRHRGTNRHATALPTERIQLNRERRRRKLLPVRRRACEQLLGGLTRFEKPCEIALNVRDEHWNAIRGQPFGEQLKRARLAGAGCASNEPVPVEGAQRHGYGGLRVRRPCFEIRPQSQTRHLECVAVTYRRPVVGKRFGRRRRRGRHRFCRGFGFSDRSL